ncbi:guanine nucleotide exchange factor [Echria macrotheca]|uniref:Guanine nucleotide exchange factor n=1 Tax=Echria macrotheca TaxID=438768 RepID=A0AAJ0BDR5_9PEZI|nr:guanine nucleotide exchange factor [Echria macrotheca]
MAAFGTLNGPAKLNAVSSLLDKLAQDLESNKLPQNERDAALEELKIYGRDPRNSDPIFTRRGIETLTKHAFNNPSTTTSRNALRVLCNALLLKPETRQIFVDIVPEAKACSQLKNDNRDDEFLISRLIFLTTYGTNIDLQKLIDQHGLAASVVGNLARHAERSSVPRSNGSQADPMEEMALVETLKLVFNVTQFCKQRVESFSAGIPHIITLLRNISPPSAQKPLDPPFASLINALMNLKFNGKDVEKAFYPDDEPTGVADSLVDLLDRSTKAYGDSELEHTVTPLVCVISMLYEHAPAPVREAMQSKLLPTDEDRQGVLGQGDNLPARLLRNSTNPLTPELRNAILHLLFDMSDKNAEIFVRNVGYGFASGFLFQNNIPVPEMSKPGDDRGAGAEGAGGRAFNPITGQFLDRENLPDLPDMTDAEKEREAERLFVLFERIKQLGVMSVQNPVEQAVQEGRFQELDDDEDDDDEDEKGNSSKTKG